MSQFFKLTYKFSSETFLFALFLSTFTTYLFFLSQDISLETMPKLLIGIATIEGIDVGKRVTLFYSTLSIFLLSFLILNGSINNWKERIEQNVLPISRLNGLSTLAILLIAGSFFSGELISVLNPILAIFLLGTIYFTIHKRLNVFSQTELEHKFIEILLISGSLAFLLRDFIFLVFKNKPVLYFSEELLVFGGIFLIIDFLITRTGKKVASFGYVTVTISLFPLISFASREVFMIMQSREITFLNDAHYVFFLFLSLSILIGFIANWKVEKMSASTCLNKSLFFFILGLALITFYKPFVEQPKEMFELANPAVSIDRFYQFGELPILENFNSHVLFELIFGFLFTTLNGHNGVEFIVYNFLHIVLAISIIYLFLKRFLANKVLSFAIVLFFPLLFVMFPFTWTMVLLIPFLIHHVYSSNSKTSLVWLLSGLVFLILWKIDLGYSSILSVLILFVIFYSSKILKFKLGSWLRALLMLMVPVVGVITYAVVKGIPLWENFLQAYHYVSSSQAHGYIDIAKSYGKIFYVHYFIFPLLMVLLMVYILGKLKENMQEIPFQTISVLFLGLFYLMNFHRGLIRHALIGSDDWVSSFAFFIIPSFLFFIPLNQHIKTIRIHLFLIISFFFGISFGYPEIKEVHVLSEEAMSAYSNAESNYSVDNKFDSRLIDESNFVESKFGDLKRFFDANMNPEATFYDYSNSPMLYHYLGRRVPSYFNQPLLSMQDEYLQKAVIKEIKENDVPFVVYSNFPTNWYDKQDGLQKNIRHYLLGEFIHDNYETYGIINNYSIWKKKDVELDVDSSFVRLSHDSTLNETYMLKKLPEIWADHLNLNDFKWEELVSLKNESSEYQMLYLFSDKPQVRASFLKIGASLNWGQLSDVYVSILNSEKKELGKFGFRVDKSGKEDYLIRLSSQRTWFTKDIEFIKISTDGKAQIHDVLFTIDLKEHE